MGKAQRLKQQRKIEWQEQEIEKRKKRKKQAIILLAVLAFSILIIIAAVILVRYLNEKDIRKVVIETDKGDIKLEILAKIPVVKISVKTNNNNEEIKTDNFLLIKIPSPEPTKIASKIKFDR